MSGIVAVGPRSTHLPVEIERMPAVSFESVYRAEFAFVWRSLRRLGVADATADDAAQDVFLIVHRRLPEFEGRSQIRTWVFGILRRVASDYRRKANARPVGREDPETLADAARGNPHEAAEHAEATRVLHQLLDQLDEKSRSAFVLIELEQMSVPEAAAALETNISTVYSRIGKARKDFETALARHTARTRWRSR